MTAKIFMIIHPSTLTWRRTGRLNTAKQLLQQAYADLKGPETNPAAAELQKRIWGHINAAHKYVDAAIVAKGGKP